MLPGGGAKEVQSAATPGESVQAGSNAVLSDCRAVGTLSVSATRANAQQVIVHPGGGLIAQRCPRGARGPPYQWSKSNGLPETQSKPRAPSAMVRERPPRISSFPEPSLRFPGDGHLCS
jgi:hypothetical protein